MAANESSRPMRASIPLNTSRPLNRRMLRATGRCAGESSKWNGATLNASAVESRMRWCDASV